MGHGREMGGAIVSGGWSWGMDREVGRVNKWQNFNSLLY